MKLSRNFHKAFLTSILIAIFSMALYGFTLTNIRFVVLPNMATTFILVFLAGWLVDKMYELHELKKRKND